MEEPWDELMGPSPEDLKRMLREDTPKSSSSSAAVRSTAPSGPPPPNMFATSTTTHRTSTAPPPVNAFAQHSSSRSSDNRMSSNNSVASSTKHLAFEDEEDEGDIPLSSNASVASSTRSNPTAIRQEALQVMEVADDRLNESNYSVHRTSTGGFSAQYNQDTKKKRVPTALRGMDYMPSGTSQRSKPFRDVAPFKTNNNNDFSVEDYDYTKEDDVVDVVGMDRRGMASRTEADTTSTSSKKWSSRYDVDKTLLSISMSNPNSKRTLDKMDKQHARNNVFNNSGAAQAPRVFGSGFSFREKNVFGKQKVTLKPPDATNLQTVWMDMDGSSLPPVNHRNKSWQEQLQQKRRQQRCYILTAITVCCFLVALGSIFGTQSHEKIFGLDGDSAQIGDGPVEPGSVTFYVTSDGPYNLQAEGEWRGEFAKISPQADFMIHLGNLQMAEQSLCPPSKYVNAAAFLKEAPITTFVLPGEDDWNNCPFPDRAWTAWDENFRFFHRNFEHLQTTSFEAMSQKDQYENFAIMQSGVLFLGIHVTSGRVHNPDEVIERDDMNLKWIRGTLDMRGEAVRAIVILGNARPGDAHNDEFFTNMANYLGEATEKPVAYIHAGGSATQVTTPFEQNKQILVVQVGDNPMMRVNVGFGDRPFILG